MDLRVSPPVVQRLLMRTTTLRHFLAVIAVLANASAHAAADERTVDEMLKRTQGITAEDIRRDYDACDSGVTSSMRLCASYRWTEQDVRLDAVYRRLLAQVGKDDLPALVHAQRAWLAYRDAQCAIEGKVGAGGGSAESLYVLSCMEDLTRQQADQLGALVHE